jgi:hypothetical protein
MDLGIIAGVAMLVVWVMGALVFDGPGWVNLLLTLGVTVIIWRVVGRSTPPPPVAPAQTRRRR